jgi:hypothetical protein
VTLSEEDEGFEDDDDYGFEDNEGFEGIEE